jgi:hypothetical protein
MARKKPRVSPAQAPAGTGDVAVLAPRAATPATPAAPARTRGVPVEKSPLDRAYAAVAKSCGSVQLAVVLLTLLVVVMAIGTMVESWYTGKLAQDLVYRTWWFQLLMAALFVNILFAALKKWPWKKHQTGFLITHLGLLTMITGAAVNAAGPWLYSRAPESLKETWPLRELKGADHIMSLVDNNGPSYQQYGDQTSNTAHDLDRCELEVIRKKDRITFDFDPGLLPWRSDEYLTVRSDPLLHTLDFIAHPYPRKWAASFDGDARIEVLNYYPHARRDPFRPATDKKDGFPALRFQLTSGVGFSLDGWVGYDGKDPSIQQWSQGPANVELVNGELTSAQLAEFLKPEQAKGGKGLLVLDMGGQSVRLDVAEVFAKDQPVKLGNTGWSVKLSKYWTDFRTKATEGAPDFPALQFELTHPDKSPITYVTAARLAGLKAGRCDNQLQLDEIDARLSVWYHPPDITFGNYEAKSFLHLALDRSGNCFYRSFSTGKGFAAEGPAGAMTFERSGSISPKDARATPLWDAMNWSLRLVEFLPTAERGIRWVPENRRAGLEKMGLLAAVRCKVTVGGKSAEVWVPKTDSSFSRVTVGGEEVQVAFRGKREKLPFTIHLERAEQTVDPGTTQAATYTSYVRLTDEERGIKDEPHVITMNEPLEHRGYKLYQTNYRALMPDPNGRPASHSALTVGRDPGLWLKYAGTAMLGLGIATMFYMRAYFVTGKRRTPTPPAATDSDTPARV